jgi:hypothetical protein
VGKRLITALAVLLLLAGFVSACGDDDDDDVAASDDTSEETTDDAVDGGEPITDFCADFNSPDDGDTPIDEVQTSIDTARAAQAETDDAEFGDAIGVLVEVLESAIDADDGDGVITQAEGEAALSSVDGAQDAAQVVSEGCGAGTDSAEDEAAQADDGGPVATFCADFNDADGGDTPVDEVQASLDRAVAAQAEATTQEGSDALQVLIEFTQHVLDNDDGDGIITDAETQAAVSAFPTIEDAIDVVTEGCGGQGL